ncbi:MAG: 30S ribosomal protein S21 [Rickettsiales bacterium]|jgi:small subunit ribosomal protein S21|nr:30S ribosomal protein S21 [Rickettsiales bacterium]
MVYVSIQSKDKLDFGLRVFKRNTQKEGIVKDAKLREAFEKPSVRRKRKAQESRARIKESKRRRRINNLTTS